MSNMSYCRFRNTLSDLRDCYEHMNEREEGDEEEEKAKRKLIEMCKDISDKYYNENDEEEEYIEIKKIMKGNKIC